MLKLSPFHSAVLTVLNVNSQVSRYTVRGISFNDGTDPLPTERHCWKVPFGNFITSPLAANIIFVDTVVRQPEVRINNGWKSSDRQQQLHTSNRWCGFLPDQLAVVSVSTVTIGGADLVHHTLAVGARADCT